MADPTPSPAATPTLAAHTPTAELPATSAPRPPRPTPVVAPATPTSAQAGGEKPRYGGVLRLHLRQAPPDYDAQVTKTYAVQYPTAAAYDKLVVADFKDESKVYPQLAERWEVSPDGTAYTFYLRQGVKFHDGTPFTSADVIATLKRWASPPRGVPAPRAALFLNVSSIEAAGDYTVKVTLKAPQASFLPGLGIGFHHIYA
ncbi:MAG: ABC transporter substrate-binding protein, partial [Chloroflexota bacterium]|nr:ABC transporter substrate-binding protein [Chloroflexota bacterium]